MRLCMNCDRFLLVLDGEQRWTCATCLERRETAGRTCAGGCGRVVVATSTGLAGHCKACLTRSARAFRRACPDLAQVWKRRPSPVAIAVLRALSVAPGQTAIDLRTSLGLSGSTWAATQDTALKHGWIARTNGSVRPPYILTERGRQALATHDQLQKVAA